MTTETPYTIEDALTDLFLSRDNLEKILKALTNSKNVILQGPPGVGKTYVAKRLAYAAIGAKSDTRVQMIQFHQSYSYEDFIQGYRPSEDKHFTLKDGVFYNFCKTAQATLVRSTSSSSTTNTAPGPPTADPARRCGKGQNVAATS